MSDGVSRYRVLEKLGAGGMGEVWLADDTQLGRKVAIKFLTEALEHDATARERLHREARSAAALDHPFICKIHEIADVDGRTGIVMEHVSGETLRATLARGPFAPRRALEIAGEMAEALDEAHTRRLVHRDLKPANVMLTEQGHVTSASSRFRRRCTRFSSSSSPTARATSGCSRTAMATETPNCSTSSRTFADAQASGKQRSMPCATASAPTSEWQG